MFRVVVPADPAGAGHLPRGAALLMVGVGGARCYHHPRDSFAERCAKAAAGHCRMVDVSFDTVEVGMFDARAGEVRLGRAGAGPLEAWLGQRVYRNDLEARGTLAGRRSQARRLALQGRTAQALRLDRRMGF